MVYPNITLSLLLVNLLVVTGKIVVEPLSKIEFESPAIFAEQIEVKFESSETTTKDYIAIYRNTDLAKDPSLKPLFYSYLCGSQDKVSCTALEAGEGSVVFNGVDPSEAFKRYWPPNPNKYKVCHRRLEKKRHTVDVRRHRRKSQLIGECKVLQVKLPTSRLRILRRTDLMSVKETYKYGEEIQIKFKSGIETQNTWIQFYGSNVSCGMWLYTGCNNNVGDQDESDDCKETAKEGIVTFGPENVGNSWCAWPPPAGEYYFSIHFLMNYPDTLYKDSDVSFFVEEEEK